MTKQLSSDKGHSSLCYVLFLLIICVIALKWHAVSAGCREHAPHLSCGACALLQAIGTNDGHGLGVKPAEQMSLMQPKDRSDMIQCLMYAVDVSKAAFTRAGKIT